ncbi:hypothetical protein SNOG_01542 [Parastagonospora nodorum SN15]|uniref:Uncharacterized protein n=1 Tax=Phaeosphaeria nodorum (strain SN15 / ATCC MYA-4574 / FGSC 10173) TaxID=321614 RepID=Q0V372_PHANO|nr:hypothetical protein SNOG_01542 [Parastagonospora nodorum SN15]EAT91191.1 hypothetical protein SNOG_01542 [Parastagonospora nodorum SN15]
MTPQGTVVDLHRGYVVSVNFLFQKERYCP